MMNDSIKILIVACTLMMAACQDKITDEVMPNTTASQWAGMTDCEQGQIVIKFAPEMTEILDNLPQDMVVTRSGIPAADQVLGILGAYRLERVFPIDPHNEQRTREAGMHLWYTVYFDETTMTAAEAAEQLSVLGEVQNVQLNRRIHPSYNRKVKPSPLPAPPRGERAKFALPSGMDGMRAFNDPYLKFQWGYINDGTMPFAQEWAPVLAGSDVNCAEAWTMCTGDSSIVVAVMDEGVMWNHPDLIANMWVNPAEEMGSDRDADGNGYAGDRYGYNFVRNSGFISAFSVNDTGHGTHVAGTIAAVNDNGIGVCGIAGGDSNNPGVRIMSLQIFDDERVATLVAEAKAMKYAADNGAVIIQCSWGYNSHLSNPLDGFTPGPANEKEWATLYPLEKEALDYFIHNAGSPNGVIDGGLAIYASGNEYSACSAFPAAYEKCLSVGSIAADYTPACYGNYGPEVDLCAPGGDEEYYAPIGDDADIYDYTIAQPLILSTLCNDGAPSYGYFEGTSMSCPHVSGVAALGLSYAAKLRRHFTREEFAALLCSTGRDINPYLRDKTKTYHRFHSAYGSPAIVMNLNNYVGKMGRLVDAGALLSSIRTSGRDMMIPNMCVGVEQAQTLALHKFYLDGESLSYSATIDNTAVAEVSISGTTLILRGKAEGTAHMTVNASNGNSQTVVVTVRRNANGNGWL